jgi:hypothetical protein
MRALPTWMGTLNTVGMVLNLIVLLVGLIMAVVAFFKKGKSKVALLGAIGFLLMFLLSCCGVSWLVLPAARLARGAPQLARALPIAQSVILFLFTLLDLIGLILIIVAIWLGGKQQETP